MEEQAILKKYVPEIESGGLSVTGPVREDNQDAIQFPNSAYSVGRGLLFAIADGMGGYAEGGIASRLALESLNEALVNQNGGSIPKALQRGVDAANLKVYRTARQLEVGRMGTTLTAAYVTEDMLHLIHVGDSRAYLIRNGKAICLTQDHTTVGDMVRSNLISYDKIRTHTQRSILTKSVGLDLFVQPDLYQQKLKEGDRIILCSDGVWSVIEDDEFARVASETVSVNEVSRNLIDLALQNETDDNASVVMFHLRKLVPVSMEQMPQGQKNASWFQNWWKFTA